MSWLIKRNWLKNFLESPFSKARRRTLPNRKRFPKITASNCTSTICQSRSIPRWLIYSPPKLLKRSSILCLQVSKILKKRLSAPRSFATLNAFRALLSLQKSLEEESTCSRRWRKSSMRLAAWFKLVWARKSRTCSKTNRRSKIISKVSVVKRPSNSLNLTLTLSKRLWPTTETRLKRLAKTSLSQMLLQMSSPKKRRKPYFYLIAFRGRKDLTSSFTTTWSKHVKTSKKFSAIFPLWFSSLTMQTSTKHLWRQSSKSCMLYSWDKPLTWVLSRCLRWRSSFMKLAAQILTK